MPERTLPHTTGQRPLQHMVPTARYAPIEFARVEAAKRRVNLITVIGRSVKLRKETTEHKGLCPFHREKDPSFAVYPDHYHCFGCGAHGDAIAWLMETERLAFHEAIDILEGGSSISRDVMPLPIAASDDDLADDATRIKSAERTWDGVIPIGGTISERYLREHRNIAIPLPATLGHHPACEYWHVPDGATKPMLLARFPALVAMVETVDGDFCGVWRIYLREDGLGRAAVPASKKGQGATAGGAVRLGAPGEDLGIGEGLESTMSAMELTGCAIPFWAALSTSGIIGLRLPDLVRRPIVFADNDKPQRNRDGSYRLSRAGERIYPGKSAAETACSRWRGEGREPSITLPCLPDFNDVLAARKGRLWSP
jgi:DNA primase